MAHSNCSYPSTDETSVDSSDDENFRRPPKVRSPIKKMGSQIQCSLAPAPQRQALFVHNVCFANGVEQADKVCVPLDVSLDLPRILMDNKGRNLKLYQEVVVPLLKDFGWQFCPLEAKFKLVCSSSTVRISTGALMRITKTLEEQLIHNNPNVNDNNEDCLISNLEEAILFSRTQSTIDLHGAVAESCSTGRTYNIALQKEALPDTQPSAASALSANIASPSVDLKSPTVKVETSLNVKVPDKPSPPIISRKRDRAIYEEKGVKGSSLKDPQDRDTAKFVSCRKAIPKFTTNKLEGEEIFPPSYLHEAIKKVFEAQCKPPSPLQQKRLLTAKFSNDITDPLTLILRAKGREDLVNDLLKLVGKRVTTIQALENARTVLGDMKSLEIDVKIDVTEDLGMKAVKPFGSNRELPGIWIASTYKGGQFQDIFGVGTNRGALLTKVGKKSVFKLADKNRLLAKAKSAYEESGKKADKWTSVTVCLNRNANLQHLDHKRVIFTSGTSIRYRDGTAYRGKWKLGPPSPQSQHHSSSSKRKSTSMPIKNEAITKSAKLASKSHREIQQILPPPKRLQRQKSEPNLSSPNIKSNPKFSNEGQRSKLQLSSLQKQQSDSCLSHSNSKDKVNIKAKQKTPYEKFREKIQLARDIEYKYAMIHLQTANGSMWNQHKLLYGESCEKDCPCLSNMKELSKNVVTDFIESQIEKDKKWSNPTNLKSDVPPVGFMSSFCPRYFDRLKQKFSKDTAEETLGKLVVMWKEHIRDRSFGLKCDDECRCDQAWDTLFLPACNRHETKGITFPSQSTIRQKRTSLMVDDISGREDFAITFNPCRESLGFYCETRKVGNGSDCSCVIISLDPGGVALKKASQIRIGTVVESSEAVTTLGKKLRIESHTDLKGRYEALKRNVGVKTRLKLYFKNPATRRWNLDLIPGNDWSETGAWVGKEKEGWAGGAMVVNVEDKRPCDELRNDPSNQTISEQERFRLPKKIKPMTAPETTKVDSGQASHASLKNRLQIKASVVQNNIEMMKTSKLSNINMQKKMKLSTSSRIEGKTDQQFPHQRNIQVQSGLKLNSKNHLVDRETPSANDERRRSFLKRSGISLPKTSPSLAAKNKAFSSSVNLPLGDCNTSSTIKKQSLVNAISHKKQITPLLEDSKISQTSCLPSILRKPGGPKVFTRVTFASKLTSEEKHVSSGSKHVESDKTDSSSNTTSIMGSSTKSTPCANGGHDSGNKLISESSVTGRSVKSNPCTNGGQDSRNGRVGGSGYPVYSSVPHVGLAAHSSVGSVDNITNGKKATKEKNYKPTGMYGEQEKKKCLSCFLMLPENAYSKTQWKKHSGGKCKRCLCVDPHPNPNLFGFDKDPYRGDPQLPAYDQDTSLKHCSSCQLLLNENQFSKKQWRSGKSKRCKSCISDCYYQKDSYDNPGTQTDYHDNKERGTDYGSTLSSSFIGGEQTSNTSVGFGSSTSAGEGRDAPGLGGYSSGSFCSMTSSSGRGESEEVVNVALHKSLEEMKTYLEQCQPSGSLIAFALNAVKRSNIDGSNDQLKKKAIFLKIYSNLFYLLGKARDLKDYAAPSSAEYKEERKMILKELYEKATWIEQFQRRERNHNRHTIINGNIAMSGGFTMLHAAVILSDPIVTAKIMAIGAYPMARCNRWGSVIDLSWNLRKEASFHDDSWIESIQSKIHDELEHYQKVACGT